MRFILLISLALGAALPIQAQTSLFNRTYTHHIHVPLIHTHYSQTDQTPPSLHFVAFPSGYFTLKKGQIQLFAEVPLLYYKPSSGEATTRTVGNVLIGIRSIAQDQRVYTEAGVYVPTFKTTSRSRLATVDLNKEEAFLFERFALYGQNYSEYTWSDLTFMLRIGGILSGHKRVGNFSTFHLLTGLGVQYQYKQFAFGLASAGRLTLAHFWLNFPVEVANGLLRQFEFMAQYQTRYLTIGAQLWVPTQDTDHIPFSYGLVATVPLF